MTTRRSSMRLLIDMQATQTPGSAHRGVGRYSSALFGGIRATADDADVRALVSEDQAHPADLGDFPVNRTLRLPALPDWSSGRKFRGGQQDDLDALAYMARVAPLSPDVIHVSHAFEGLGQRVALPTRAAMAPGQILSTTLYDLIPLVFPEHYFQDETFRLWYRQRLAWMRDADLLLAISEASRQDAITRMGVEPWRVVTIGGGISDHFKPFKGSAAKREKDKKLLARRYGLKLRFAVYTGGDDFRKNIAGAIRGFAAVPPSQRADWSLVIVCAMEPHRQDMYRDIAKVAGLDPASLIITGFVPEEDLVSFYQQCDLLVFPSLYEGLGFPVLEGMACGAPVIGGNNSSIRELIERPDALFDASSTEAIAAAMAKVMGDNAFSESLRLSGLARARDFTWDNSARIAVDAFEEAVQRKQHAVVAVASAGGLPRRRLAMLTPLPPSRSGIADYNADFLPFLSRHFEVDLYVAGDPVSDERLTSAFRIFDVAGFEKVAGNYDAILYEFGNSEFHAHMLPLLEKFPGVVGLHDAYLSGLMGYLDFFLGDHGSYQREMIASHGPRARRYFMPCDPHPDGNGGSMVNLPCIRRVLRQATGLISHSPYNLTVARESHPEGWRAPFRIIPQMVHMPLPVAAGDRARLRAERGFTDADIVVATFGHIAWTKCGDLLLAAVEKMAQPAKGSIHLIFAGELARDDFGERLKQKVAASRLGDRVRITGYLDDADYGDWVHAADIAVQLRINSRGGTPRGVLDCMARGVPVVVNDDASYRDYPDDVVAKVPPEPEADALAAMLRRLAGSRELRERFGAAGLAYVRTEHDPAGSAAHYAAAIDAFAAGARQTDAAATAMLMAPHLAQCGCPADAIQAAREWLSAPVKPHFERRRLLIDVTYLSAADHQTGIPRVVKEITRAAYCADLADFEPVAVALVDGELRRAAELLRDTGICGGAELEMPEYQMPVVPTPGDILLMIDSSWHQVDDFARVFAAARSAQVPIYTVVYDLLPMTLPSDCIVSGGREWFEGWINKAMRHSDGLIGISRSAAEEVADYVEQQLPPGDRPAIGFWHLGSDFGAGAQAEAGEDVGRVGGQRYLLMVGTIEPRKSHAIALDAMEQLWAVGQDLCLVIAGRQGWLVDDLMVRIRGHAELGRRLFFFDGPTDAEIAFLYRHAQALLFLSKGEGFGLPLVEAAHYGTALICSDLPVFREIGEGFAWFVDHTSGTKVAAGILSWSELKAKSRHPDSRAMPRLSWKQSAEQLIDVVMNNRWIRNKW